MEMVKMFDWFEEIQPYLNTLDIAYDLCDLGECISNDSAVSFHVTIDKDDNDFYRILTRYFLNHGCKEGETVYIWISWQEVY